MAALFVGREEDIERPEEAEWPEWSGYISRAWQALRDDRHYGAMGGLGGIYYTAKSRYADDHNIIGDAFDEFLIFIEALDGVYIAHVNEKQKAETEKNKKP